VRPIPSTPATIPTSSVSWLSQDKDPVSRRQVMAALRGPGPYQHVRLADDMERAEIDR
jgi:hypothetical protein